MSIFSSKMYSSSHSLLFNTSFTQFKDQFNYGLVHSGGNFKFGYQYIKPINKNRLEYNTDLSFGAMYNKGIGINIGFKAVDLSYHFQIYKNLTDQIYLAPYYSMNYSWQMYPELQSGHMLWMSSFELGAKLSYKSSIDGRNIILSLSSPIIAFTSRPKFQTETYYYSLAFSDFVENVHRDMKLNSQDVFNHIIFSIEHTPEDSKFSYAYNFEYINYNIEPYFKKINHSISLFWRLGE